MSEYKKYFRLISLSILLIMLFFYSCGFGFVIKHRSKRPPLSFKSRIVMSESDAKACYYDARKFNESLGLFLEKNILVKAVNRDEIRREYAKTHSDSPSEVFALYKTRPQTIWFPLGYEYYLVMPACSHELAHAWQTDNCPPHQNILLKEGLASWVQAKAYSFLSRDDLARSRMRSSVEREQRVINYLIDFERNGGCSAVLDFCRKNSSLPKEILQ